MIRFFCECGRQLQASEEYIGQAAACPLCKRTTVVPPSDQRRPAEPRPETARINEYGEITRRPPDATAAPRPRPYEDRPRPGPPVARATSGMATASVVCGMLSFPCLLGLLTGLPAIVLGVLALRNPRVRSGELAGKGSAVAGIILGCVGVLALVPLFFARSSVRVAAERQQEANNLKLIGLAMYHHHDALDHMPASAAFYTKEGKPGLSWRVALLPYIEQESLYRQFRLDEPWDSPHNLALLRYMPKTYLQPGQKDDGSGLTHYQVFVGPRAAFEDVQQAANPFGFPGRVRRGPRIADFTDGTSNTILVAVGSNPVPWTKPDDLRYDPNLPLPPLLERSNGTQVLMGDASVRWLPRNTPQATIRALITRDGGEVVNVP